MRLTRLLWEALPIFINKDVCLFFNFCLHKHTLNWFSDKFEISKCCQFEVSSLVACVTLNFSYSTFILKMVIYVQDGRGFSLVAAA